MYSFPNLEPVCCSMSISNCCLLTCIQISQDVGKVVWYSHLLKNFPQFVVIYRVKGFGIINKAELDIFLELSCFFYDPTGDGNLICGSSAFSKSSLNIWKFKVHILLKPGLENFEHYFASVWDEYNCVVVWTFFGIVLLWDWNENWPFPVLWPLLSFPNLPTYWVHIDFAFKWTLIPSTNWFLTGTFPNPCLSINTLPANQWAKLRVSCHSFLFPLSPSPLPCQMTRIELSASSIRVHLSLAYFVPLNSASTFWALLKLIPWLFWNPWAPLVVYHHLPCKGTVTPATLPPQVPLTLTLSPPSQTLAWKKCMSLNLTPPTLEGTP